MKSRPDAAGAGPAVEPSGASTATARGPVVLQLRTLIAIALGSVVILGVCGASWMIMLLVEQRVVSVTRTSLAALSERQAERLTALIDELERDVRLLSNVPPIQGIVRARANAGTDPVDGSSEALWRSRLESIFNGMLLSKPHYLQVRYIGAADGGLELLRVYRDITSGKVATATELQRRGDEDYVRLTLQQPPGQVYFSDVDLNREFGQISPERIPVIRAAMPVHSATSGEPFGVVVINLRANYFFRTVADLGSDNTQFGVTNADGEYLVDPEGGQTFAFEDGQSHNALDDLPALAEVLRGEGHQSEIDVSRSRMVHMRRVDYGPSYLHRSLGMIATQYEQTISQFISDVIRRVLIALIPLLIISVLVSIALAYLIAKPINTLAAAFRGWAPGQPAPALPPSLYGEAQELGQVLSSSFEQLYRRNRELEASNRELDQFAYIASHDLQEPVRTITTFTEMLSDDPDNRLSPRSQKGLSFMLQSSNRMRDLIHGLLEYSRIGVHADPEPVDLNLVLGGVVRDLSASIDQRNAKVVIPDGLPTLRLYPVEVQLLFQNLISNAIKFCPDERQPRVEVNAERIEPKRWRFRIRDNGIGVPARQREKIFTIFQRATGRDEFEGTGIGLAHCRKIAELHYGRIWVSPSSEMGSEFCVELAEV